MTIICLDFESRRISTMAGRPGLGAEPGPVLSSLIYPIEVIDALDVVSPTVRSSLMEPVDELSVSSSVEAGDLIVTIAYQTINAADSVNVSSDVEAASIETIISYETIDAAPESISVSSDVASGSLEVVIVYVVHTIPPEGLDVSSTLESGSLE